MRLGDWTHVLNWIKVWTDKRMDVHGKIISASRELDFHATNLGTHPEKCVKTLFYTGTETNMLLTFESRVAKNLSDLKGKSRGGCRERNGAKKHLSLIRCLCLYTAQMDWNPHWCKHRYILPQKNLFYVLLKSWRPPTFQFCSEMSDISTQDELQFKEIALKVTAHSEKNKPRKSYYN